MNKDMNLMFLYKRWFLCLLMSLGLLSCESVLELEAPSETFVDRQTVFSDAAGAEAAARGMYAEMVQGEHTFYTIFNGGLIILTDMSADILTQPGQLSFELLQFEQNALMADNSMIEKVWKSLYRSIYSANVLWESLDPSGLDESLVRRLQGEALFVRAFCHFYLVNLFGDVPLVLNGDFRKNANIPRTSAADVYAQIEADLIQARNYLDWNYEGERTRPNKGAATALLARVYLFTENWGRAADMATEVLEQTQQYELVAPEAIVRANNREALWQFHISNTSANAATVEANIFQSPFSAHRFNAIRDGFIDSFEAGDLRKIEWINQHVSGAYLSYKYKRTTGSSLPLEYSTVLRLVEVYLIRAEARAHSGDLQGGIADLDAVRGRADLPLFSQTNPGISQTDLLNAIIHERKVEFFTEWGHRWLDLKRTGRGLEVLTPIKPGFTENDLLWPLPQKEINNNPALRGHQNPGY